MGYYIQTSGVHGKAGEIVIKFSGNIIPKPNTFAEIPNDKGLVCVVDNGSFEAAGFIYNEDEFRAFTHPDEIRPREWVLIDRKDAERESGYS